MGDKISHKIFLIPGLFGFGKLAGYDYFGHVKKALAQNYERADERVEFHEILPAPTSSLKNRARTLARTVARCTSPQDQIHLLGHSTGGLDARLALAPSIRLGLAPEDRVWQRQTQSLLTLNTPHFGTPLASYFATVSGTRMLYALSLLTVISLRLGEPSLAIFSRLLAAVGGIDAIAGGDLKVFSKLTGGILRFVDQEARSEITDYLDKVQTDQGAVIQITPEAMDLFNAAVENAEHVRYGSILAAAPRPASLRAARRIRSPYTALTAALYSTLYQFTGQRHESYKYAHLSPEELRVAEARLGRSIGDVDNDGIVPSLSMKWGELVGIFDGDHLDMLGHFQDDQKPQQHIDWLTSGAKMNRARFQELMSRIAEFQLSSCSLS
ncbi:MAG: hypothetical protein MK135_10460 [Polyangiaceae bacterium]|nr:hypothetical protein [Polyangiaceae bacterium]